MAEGERPKPPPALPRDAHKGTAGRVLVLCGTADMPGAAILVCRAAHRAGAGRVTLGLVDRELAALVPVASPETVLVPLAGGHAGLDALRGDGSTPAFHARVIGCGLGDTERTRRLVAACLDEDFRAPQVFDADALNAARLEPELFARAAGPVVITPHGGEARALLGRDVPGDEAGRVEAARELAGRVRGICVLKGAGTVVTDGERVVVNDTGNPGMATAGTGDVLSGILVAYLAASALAGEEDFGTFDAVAAAVRVHGRAGDLAAAELGQRALIASDLIAFLPAAQREES